MFHFRNIQYILLHWLMASFLWTVSFGAVSNFWRRGFGNVRKSQRLQNIYDNLTKIKNWPEAISHPLSTDELISCIDNMNQLNAEDIGIDSGFVDKLRYSVCMSICSTPHFDIALFIIPAGCGIPLHDHPNMTVLSKLVIGDMTIRSFTPLDKVSVTNSFPAVIRDDQSRSSSDPAWFLTPSEGNIHEFVATSGCIVFDVLLPPYEDPDRPCTFYRAEVGALGSSSTGATVFDLTPTPPPRSGLPYSVEYPGPRPVSR